MWPRLNFQSQPDKGETEPNWRCSPTTAITPLSPIVRGIPWQSDHRRHAEIENAIRDLSTAFNHQWSLAGGAGHGPRSLWARRWQPPRPSGDLPFPGGKDTRKARQLTLTALALENVTLRPGAVASPATAFLFDPPPDYPTCPSRDRLGSGLRLQSALTLLVPLLRNYGPSRTLGAASTPHIVHFIGIRSSPARSLVPHPSV